MAEIQRIWCAGCVMADQRGKGYKSMTLVNWMRCRLQDTCSGDNKDIVESFSKGISYSAWWRDGSRTMEHLIESSRIVQRKSLSDTWWTNLHLAPCADCDWPVDLVIVTLQNHGSFNMADRSELEQWLSRQASCTDVARKRFCSFKIQVKRPFRIILKGRKERGSHSIGEILSLLSTSIWIKPAELDTKGKILHIEEVCELITQNENIEHTTYKECR